MPIEVKCKPDNTTSGELRQILCKVAVMPPEPSFNPLVETRFNELLDRLADKAFQEGIQFARDYKGKTTIIDLMNT